MSLIKFLSVVSFAVIGFLICANADVSHIAPAAAPTPIAAQIPSVQRAPVSPPVTEICLGCICEAISGCNSTLGCNGEVCGLFRITWAYWSDSGKPTQQGESPESPTAYPNCVNEPYCAARAVQGYMAKFGQDCNGDGVINCLDHAAIHKLGGYGCSGYLQDFYKNRLDQCLQQVGAFKS